MNRENRPCRTFHGHREELTSLHHPGHIKLITTSLTNSLIPLIYTELSGFEAPDTRLETKKYE